MESLRDEVLSIRSTDRGRRVGLEDIGSRLTLEELINIPVFAFYSLSGQFSFPFSTEIRNYFIFPLFWLTTICLFVANRTRVSWKLWTCRFAFLFLFYNILSLTWNDSLNSFPFIVGITAICTFFYYNYLIDRFRLNELTRMLVWTFAIELVFSVLFVFLLRRFGIDDGSGDPNNAGAWRGIFVQKNNLGAVSAFAVAVAMGLRPKSFVDRFWRWLLLIVGFACSIGSQSRESWIAIAIIVVSSVILKTLRQLEPQSRIPVVIGTLAFSVALLGVVYLYLDDLLHLIGRTRTASGRTPIWDATWLLIQRRPWFGYGLVGVWGTPHAWDVQARVGWAVTSSHNNYLEILLSFGIIGMLIYLPIIVSSLLYMLRALLSYDLRDLQVLIYGMIVILVISMAIAYIMYSPSLGLVLLLYFVSQLEKIERTGFMKIGLRA